MSVYGGPTDTPRTDEARSQICDYVADLLAAYPTVNDVVMWTTPDSSGH